MSYCKSNYEEHLDYLLKKFNVYTNNYEDSPEVNDIKRQYIISATEVVENYLGYKLDIHEVTEEHTFIGSHDFYLKSFPVQEVYNVILADGTYLPAPYYSLRGDHVRIQFPRDDFFAESCKLWKNDEITIIYAAGYRQLPDIVTQTILRIASLLQSESQGNIALQSKSYGNDGSRSFFNYTNWSKFLDPLYPLRVVRLV